jgi:hypothetical protein
MQNRVTFELVSIKFFVCVFFLYFIPSSLMFDRYVSLGQCLLECHQIIRVHSLKSSKISGNIQILNVLNTYEAILYSM